MKWPGTPIYYRHASMLGGGGRVFSRDVAGEIVAEFPGPNGYENARLFCEMFGEPNGWRTKEVVAATLSEPKEGEK